MLCFLAGDHVVCFLAGDHVVFFLAGDHAVCFLHHRLLVSAPNETVTDRQHSGIHYLCDPNFLSTSSSTSPCVERTSLPRGRLLPVR